MGETSNITLTLKSKVSVKLTVDKASNRVLFAEAGKDFVDFLFHIHELPIGTASQLVHSVSDDTFGSIRNITDSIRNLPDRYMISKQKSALLGPDMRNCMTRLKVTSTSKVPRHQTAYRCNGSLFECRVVVLDNPYSDCPVCYGKRGTACMIVEPSDQAVVMLLDGEGGYVKGLATYMVTDDLTVKPMMFNSCCDLLREFKVKRLGDIEEKVVDVDSDTCKKLVEATIRSKTALTDTFLPRKLT